MVFLHPSDCAAESHRGTKAAGHGDHATLPCSVSRRQGPPRKLGFGQQQHTTTTPGLNPSHLAAVYPWASSLASLCLGTFKHDPQTGMAGIVAQEAEPNQSLGEKSGKDQMGHACRVKGLCTRFESFLGESPGEEGRGRGAMGNPEIPSLFAQIFVLSSPCFAPDFLLPVH